MPVLPKVMVLMILSTLRFIYFDANYNTKLDSISSYVILPGEVK